ncbi:MAG: peptide deformylase [Candidatus Marinimicrobia bacterium]|mgnify:FL=1|nr:peptide deformylase [Candidatus Neomarinimicrobiota bacterium]
MSLLPVVKYGDPILRSKVDEVTDFSNIESLIDDMFDTMYHESGIGLAANQVGVKLAILVFDIGEHGIEGDKEVIGELFSDPKIFINPLIVESAGECSMEEGCLSVPEIRAEIIRAETIILQYDAMDQNAHSETFSGLSARVLLHEIDHLNGKFFTDYLSPSKRMLIQKRLKEISLTGTPTTGIIL